MEVVASRLRGLRAPDASSRPFSIELISLIFFCCCCCCCCCLILVSIVLSHLLFRRRVKFNMAATGRDGPPRSGARHRRPRRPLPAMALPGGRPCPGGGGGRRRRTGGGRAVALAGGVGLAVAGGVEKRYAASTATKRLVSFEAVVWVIRVDGWVVVIRLEATLLPPTLPPPLTCWDAFRFGFWILSGDATRGWKGRGRGRRRGGEGEGEKGRGRKGEGEPF